MTVEVNRRMVEQCRLLDEALSDLGRHSRALAAAERDYRKAKARAWVDAVTEGSSATAKHKEAVVDAKTADLRHDRDLADYLRVQSLEAIRSARQQLSAMQSEAAGEREEAKMLRTGPEFTP